ncbi:protein twisted gastrulation [Trichinella spiralis]|uniref:Protein twisted gastrulation n=1 Tax=Trichinella spiralis TaxID=6334 RepID=E5SIQ0_TRISP|nr:protein twisted gastrulation [Trichinella spiralis]KRY35524.1 Protein twisted gastrulation [Trichinella spiralis]
MSILLFATFLYLFVGSFGLLTRNFSCSEAICGPRVSKCMLIKSCNCSMTPEDLVNKNCSCCKDCFHCLGELFTDCCSCVGLCRASVPVDPRMAMRSYVESLNPAEDQISLFELVTAQPLSPDSKWTVHSFPTLEPGFFYKFNIEQRREEMESLINVNCTVAFLKQCLSVEKCRSACSSMGASAYRWFHTGCCECVGQNCIDFGIRESLCEECGELEELEMIIQITALQFMRYLAKPVYSDTGHLLDGGVDLNLEGGISEYCKDAIILSFILQLLSLIHAYFWALYLLCPCFVIYKLWVGVLAPWIFQPSLYETETSAKKGMKLARKMNRLK